MDITGNKYARLTALRRGEKKGGWVFRCDCGTEKEIRWCSVKAGRSTSCGCYRDEVAGQQSLTHGHAKGRGSPEYTAWCGAKDRCFNPDSQHYAYYGGRGITMHESWINDFQAFFDHMGPRPKGKTLDRIETDGHYEPGNCRWATRIEQAINRRNTLPAEVDGQQVGLLAFARDTGLIYSQLYQLMKAGLSAEQAAHVIREGPPPKQPKPSPAPNRSWRYIQAAKHAICYEGQPMTLKALADLLHIDCARLKYLTQFHRLTPEEAVTEILSTRRRRP